MFSPSFLTLYSRAPPENYVFSQESTKGTVQYFVGNDKESILKQLVAPTTSELPTPSESQHKMIIDVDAIVHCAFAGGKASTILDVWPELHHSVKWIHSLSAGVDALAPVLRRCEGIGGESSAVVVTNARGAFSRSLVCRV